MRILITTGIYPPALGGPAQYAYNLGQEWGKAGHSVWIRTYGLEPKLATGVRHFYFFLKIIPAVLRCDFIFALDTFSVGWPATLAAKIFRKKIIMRTGGDFLWEGYVERTRDLALLTDFYKTTREKWSLKERIIFRLTRWTVQNVDLLVFSTRWQQTIWMQPYGLEEGKIRIVENYYGPKEQSIEPAQKNFIAGTRKLVWKNLDVLKEAFAEVPEAALDLDNYPYETFMKKISECYATILVSLGDISPNMILDAIRHNKPFIITEENGLMDRIGGMAITVDPKNSRDIREKILWLCKKENYDMQVQKIKSFNFTHTWQEIAQEILKLV